jgi:hypothetical protein
MAPGAECNITSEAFARRFDDRRRKSANAELVWDLGLIPSISEARQAIEA